MGNRLGSEFSLDW
ncbi:hypothetical protein F383_31700 [Gossypium arboreum]|uniref:Uncharacterized protein n=1 Tax=Gossypium arboreum TaxID=29729 RepID=A0A0B0PCX6_GOSAR|nr:hypothetical protein F383_31700 [Gossypium arboreum]